MLQLDREQLAWAAGFFDGEGNAGSVLTKGHMILRLQVGNTDLELLRRFKAAVGDLGKIGGPYRQTASKEHHKSKWLWSCYRFVALQAVVALLWPWLGTAKRKQISAAFKASR
jgi:hypothetical protein